MSVVLFRSVKNWRKHYGFAIKVQIHVIDMQITWVSNYRNPLTTFLVGDL